MTDPTATHTATPTPIYTFVGKEYSGATDDLLRAHHGQSCAIVGPVDDTDDKVFVMFADGYQGIAFTDELAPV